VALGRQDNQNGGESENEDHGVMIGTPRPASATDNTP
jgi:hypothetical protein